MSNRHMILLFVFVFSDNMAFVIPSPIGGYEHKFVSTLPDSLVCKLCIHPCRNPYLSGCCGHNFCKSCLDNARRASVDCPYCQNKEFTTFLNKLSDREIRSLHVMCTNKERGCEWQGELNDINNHLGNSDGCQFEDVKCSNECGKMLQRQHLAIHVDTECPCYKVDCQYCQIRGDHWFIEGEHKEQCPKFPLPCPNNCIDNCSSSRRRKRRAKPYPSTEVKYVPREDMESHKKECPLESVECSLRCSKSLQRQFLTSHVQTKCPRRKVDCHYCHIAGEHQYIDGEHKELCPKLPLLCPNECEVRSVCREDMEAHMTECPLEMVQCEYHNVGCEERMTRKDLEKHEEENIREHLTMTKSELSGTKSQLATALKQIDTLMITTQALISQKHTMTSSDAFVSVAVRSVKLSAIASRIKSGDQNCPIIVKVTEFSTKKNNEIQWYSDSFFSHEKGYKMCLRVDAAGDVDTNLSVFLFIMKSPHDDELTWPLRGKFNLKLLNQISDTEHHSKTMDYLLDKVPDQYAGRVTDSDRAKNGWGYTQFISHKELHKVTPLCQYLKDDCIFLQVSKL